MINRHSKKRFNQTFRLASNPNIQVKGFFAEAPTQIRYANNPPLMLEVAHGNISLLGQQIISTEATKQRYLVGAFLTQSNSVMYRCYEATHQLNLVREKNEVHPVTKMPTATYNLIEPIWVTVEPVSQRYTADLNPTQAILIRSTLELWERDQLGPYSIRNVYKENGLYVGQAEYETVKPDKG